METMFDFLFDYPIYGILLSFVINLAFFILLVKIAKYIWKK